VPAGVQKVGVFVNETVPNVLATARKYDLDAVQLHGQETPETCAQLLASGLQVWKVFSVGTAFSQEMVTPYTAVSTHFLFDTATPAHGGSGKTFAWDLLDNLCISLPAFLSGGINPDNLDAAIAKAAQLGFGLDINSGIETAPGLKDPSLAAAVVQRVRSFALTETL
jgi:phosphoribosylanthranilate isomerase